MDIYEIDKLKEDIAFHLANIEGAADALVPLAAQLDLEEVAVLRDNLKSLARSFYSKVENTHFMRRQKILRGEE